MGKKGRKKKQRKDAAPAAARISSEGRRDVLIAGGLTLVAFVHRLFFLFSNIDRTWPYTIFYQGDAETFFRHARALLAGALYDQGIPFHPPGFPAFLAAVHTMLGAGGTDVAIPHLKVKVFLALVGSLSIGLLYLLARPYVGRPVALIAALLGAYHFGLYVLSVATVSEGLYTTLLLAVLLLWTRRLDHPLSAPQEAPRTAQPAWAFVLGLLLGSMALVRAEGGLVAFALVATGLVGLFQRWRQDRESFKGSTLAPWVLVCVAWVLVVAPWTARNARRLGELNEEKASQWAEPLPTFVPVTIYGPLNLALANFDGADGTFSPHTIKKLTGVDGLRFEYEPHLNLMIRGDEVAWAWIRENPGTFAGLALKRCWMHLDVLRLGWTQWNVPVGLEGFRRPVDMFLPDAVWLKYLMVALIFLGLGVCLRTPGDARRWALIVLVISAMGFATTCFFYGYARQGGLYLPLWLTLAAAALWKGLERLPARRLAAAAAVAAVLLFVVEATGVNDERSYEASGDTLDGTIINPDDLVRLKANPSS